MPRPYGDRAEFEGHVRRAVASLPTDLRQAMTNVAIVVEDENPEDPDLFGLYTGVPLTERGSGYAGSLPDKIEIYRVPLEDEFGDDPAVLEQEIRVTVLHEIAHHFGIDEHRLDELGWAWGQVLQSDNGGECAIARPDPEAWTPRHVPPGHGTNG